MTDKSAPHLEEIKPGSTWRHVGFGYLSVVEAVSGRAVSYARLAAKTRFTLNNVEFVKAYHQTSLRRSA